MNKHRLRIGILIGSEIALPWINILIAWDKMFSKDFTLDLITNVAVPEYIKNNYNNYKKKLKRIGNKLVNYNSRLIVSTILILELNNSSIGVFNIHL